jgi:hypothetical protein
MPRGFCPDCHRALWGPGYLERCDACDDRFNRASRDATWRSNALGRCEATGAGHVFTDLTTSEGSGQLCLACSNGSPAERQGPGAAVSPPELSMAHLIQAVTYKSARRGIAPTVDCSCGLRLAGETDAEAALAFRDHLRKVLGWAWSKTGRKQAPQPKVSIPMLGPTSHPGTSADRAILEEAIATGSDVRWWE